MIRPFVFFAAILTSASAISRSPDVLVLTNNQYNFSSKQALIYNLDEPFLIEDVINKEMHKANLTKDKNALKKVLNKYPNVEAKLKKAWQGILLARKYNIKKLPAIVINNGEAVLYGPKSVKEAIAIYSRWKTL